MAETRATEHEQLMRDYNELWNGDFSKLAVVADAVAIKHPAAPDGELHGREALEAFIGEYHSAFPDFHIEVHDWISQDEVIMKEYTMTGTHEGAFNDVPATGREIKSTGMGKIVVADGKVQEDRIYFNRLEALEQLGFTEA